MDYFYSVVILLCILSMISLAIDVGKNTILSSSDIKWFRFTFILVIIGAFALSFIVAYLSGNLHPYYKFVSGITL